MIKRTSCYTARTMRRVSVVNHYECVLFIKTIPLEIQFHNFWSFIESLYKELISQSQINIITIDAGVFPTPLVFVGEVCTVPSRRINIHRCAGNTAPSLRVLRHVQPVLATNFCTWYCLFCFLPPPITNCTINEIILRCTSITLLPYMIR